MPYNSRSKTKMKQVRAAKSFVKALLNFEVIELQHNTLINEYQ